MTRAEIEILINERNEQVKERRNAALRARLARPCTREEQIARLGALSDYTALNREGEIPLTNACPQYIMEVAR